MTQEAKREQFAGVVEYIDDRLHPKGPPGEPQPLQVSSIEENAQLFADELQEPTFKQPLVDLLHDLGENPVVDGVGLVSLYGSHLSIRVLTDLTSRGEQWQSGQRAIQERYNAFAQLMIDAMPRPRDVSWGINFYNTAGSDVNALVPEILTEISKEVGASAVSFVMYPKPASPLG